MSCIVGLVDKGRVYLGGDSAATDDNFNLSILKDPKVFRNGNMLIGPVGSLRMSQLLQYDLEVPRHPPKMDDMRYMSKVFINAVRECLKKGGLAKTNNDEELGGFFIVGYRGGLFEVQEDYQISKTIDNYSAVGSGDNIALGSLFSTHGRCISSKQRVLTALQAAEKWNASVKGPFHIIDDSD